MKMEPMEIQFRTTSTIKCSRILFQIQFWINKILYIFNLF